jgi:hypothetical protein
MMRVVVLILLLANLGFYAWTQGWLDAALGVSALGDREPERLARQVSPQAIRILPPQPAPRVAANVCMEAGPFTPAQVPAAQAVLQAALPAGGFSPVSQEVAPVWTVYMGRFANREALERKLEELQRLQLPHQEVTTPEELAPGVSLGRFGDAAAANKALTEFAQRGVRTAKVVELSPATTQVMLRVASADASAQALLAGLRDDALLGKTFAPCAGEVAAER